MSKLSVFFILPSYSKKASSPTKLAELMAMGVPVLCNAGVGDVADIVKRSEAGWVMSDFDDVSMKAMAHTIAVASPADSEKLRLAAKEYGSLERGASRYAGVYANIIGD
jgi:glycosyltransferase involved in cell wall biosynthesis